MGVDNLLGRGAWISARRGDRGYIYP